MLCEPVAFCGSKLVTKWSTPLISIYILHILIRGTTYYWYTAETFSLVNTKADWLFEL